MENYWERKWFEMVMPWLIYRIKSVAKYRLSVKTYANIENNIFCHSKYFSTHKMFYINSDCNHSTYIDEKYKWFRWVQSIFKYNFTTPFIEMHRRSAQFSAWFVTMKSKCSKEKSTILCGELIQWFCLLQGGKFDFLDIYAADNFTNQVIIK